MESTESGRPSRIKQVLVGGKAGDRVLVNGWVRTRRDSKGGFSFIELNDGSYMKNLQIIAEAKLENYQTEVLKIAPGACISVAGVLAESEGKGQSLELNAGSPHVHGSAD